MTATTPVWEGVVESVGAQNKVTRLCGARPADAVWRGSAAVTLSDRDWARLVRLHPATEDSSKSPSPNSPRVHRRARSILESILCESRLTPAELEVATRLLVGEAISDIADARDTGESTAKSQLGRIYLATDSSGQHALLSNVLKRVLLMAAHLAEGGSLPQRHS